MEIKLNTCWGIYAHPQAIAVMLKDNSSNIRLRELATLPDGDPSIGPNQHVVHQQSRPKKKPRLSKKKKNLRSELRTTSIVPKNKEEELKKAAIFENNVN